MNSVSDQRNRSRWRILIVGTGGQGVLTAARMLCEYFVEQGRDVVSGQLHGMAQRGGSVASTVIIDAGSCPVIARGGADFVLGFEPVETARALPFMSSGTITYMNTAAVVPYVLAQRFVAKEEGTQYPDVGHLADSIKAVTPLGFTFDATRCSVDAGSARSLNMVMLGCLVGSNSLPCTAEEFWDGSGRRIPAALREINTKAFFQGVDLGRRCRVGEGGL